MFQQFDSETSLFDATFNEFGTSFDLFTIGDVSANVSSVEELGTELGYSQTAPACMAELIYRHSVRRSIDSNGADDSAISHMVNLWVNTGDTSMKALLRTIVTSENFITLFE